MRVDRYYAGMRAAYRHAFRADPARARRAERGFLLGNAYNFLGLAPRQETRKRLESFYRRNGINLSNTVLGRLDKALAESAS
jgi:hypothetical protein